MVLEAGARTAGEARRADSMADRRRVLIGAAVLAVIVRLVPTLIHGGWLGLGRYDDGVYLGMSCRCCTGSCRTATW